MEKPAELAAVISPIRQDILDRLVALGPLPVSALAKALGRKPTAIYRHLQTLEDLKLIVASEVTGQRGRPATVYKSAAPRMRSARAARHPENFDVMSKMARTMATHAARQYTSAFKNENRVIEGPGRNHWAARLFTAPSPKKLARINALLDELAELMWTPDPNPGPLLRVTWFMSPSSESKRKPRKKS